MAIKTLYALPDEARSSYVLNPARSYLSIVRPVAAMNLVFDPECQGLANGTVGGWSETGSAEVFVSGDRQRRGIFSVLVTNAYSDGDGVRYNLHSTTASQRVYTFSFDHYGPGKYRAYILNTGTGNQVASAQFVGRSFWTRQSVQMYSASSMDVALCVVCTELVGSFNVDGFQFEIDGPTTFISGDLREDYAGQAQYGWLGSPHNSASYRLGTARSGGEPIPLNEFGLDVFELMDWGMPKPEHSLSRYALRNGSYYHRSALPEREVTFTAQATGGDMRALLKSRNQLLSLMDPTANRPFRMHFQLFDGIVPQSEAVEFDALYSEGLEGEIKALNEERISTTLIMPDPFFYAEGNAGKEVTMYTTVSNAGPGVVGRDSNGIWRALSGTSGFPVDDFIARAMIVGQDYNLYAIGHADGDENHSYIMRWDGIDWQQIGPVWAGPLRAICWGPGNSLLIAGSVSRAIGDPMTGGFGVFKYNLSDDTYIKLGNTYFINDAASEGGIRSIVMHPDGYVIVGGAFTSFNDGITPTSALNVAHFRLDYSLWQPMGLGLVPRFGGGGPVGAVNALVVAPDKSVWAGGDYDPNELGKPVVLARWSFHNREWYPIEDYPMVMDESSIRTPAAINAMLMGRDGTLYIAGQFNTSRSRNEVWGDFLPLTHVAAYSPQTYAGTDFRAGTMRGLQLGTNFQTDDGFNRLSATALAMDAKGKLYVGGNFTKVRILLPRSGDYEMVPVSIFVPGLAVYDTATGRWLQPETTLAPIDPENELAGVLSIAVGGSFNQNRGSTSLGSTQAGNALLTELGLAISPGLDNTVFASARMELGAAIPTTDTIDVGCSVDTRPILKFYGEGILFSIENFTNGTSIQFDSVALYDGEVLTVDLSRPRPIAYRGSGSTYGIVAKGSALSTFRLEPGVNRVKVTFLSLVSNHATSTRHVTMTWKPRYLAIDALAGGCE